MTALRVRAAAVCGCLLLVAVGVGSCGETTSGKPKAPSAATSARDVGGMDALVAAAKKEGILNAIALPRDWANYGGLIDGFEKKYGITVMDDNPQGPSQAEIDAIKSRKGQPTAPDVIDVGDTFARSAARQNLLAPYRVAAFGSIARNQKDSHARWYNNYGGYMSIGCNANRVKVCPETFADLLKPQYKGQVSLAGDPTTSATAFASVYAAAIAYNGSFGDIQPGLDFFAKLKQIGNFDPVQSDSGTIQSGRTLINIHWDYANLGYEQQLRSQGIDWQVAIPFDGSFAQYYGLAVSKYAPHPAAARLWQEYLFSAEGQNLRLQAFARPVLIDAMRAEHTLDEAAAAKLPTVEGTPEFPTDAQTEKAQQVVAQGWAKAVAIASRADVQ